MDVISKFQRGTPSIRGEGVNPTPPIAGGGMGGLFPSCITTKNFKKYHLSYPYKKFSSILFLCAHEKISKKIFVFILNGISLHQY